MFTPCQCQHPPRAAGAGMTTNHRSLTADHSGAVSWALNAYHSRAVAAAGRA